MTDFIFAEVYIHTSFAIAQPKREREKKVGSRAEIVRVPNKERARYLSRLVSENQTAPSTPQEEVLVNFLIGNIFKKIT